MFLSFPEDSTTLSSEILSGFVSHLLIRVNLCLLWHRLVELFIATILGLKMRVVGKWHAQCTLCFVWWLLKTFMKFYIKYIWHIDSLVLYINYFYSKSCEKLINLHFTTPLQSPLPLPQNLGVTSQPQDWHLWLILYILLFQKLWKTHQFQHDYPLVGCVSLI